MNTECEIAICTTLSEVTDSGSSLDLVATHRCEGRTQTQGGRFRVNNSRDI